MKIRVPFNSGVAVKTDNIRLPIPENLHVATRIGGGLVERSFRFGLAGLLLTAIVGVCSFFVQLIFFVDRQKFSQSQL